MVVIEIFLCRSVFEFYGNLLTGTNLRDVSNISYVRVKVGMRPGMGHSLHSYNLRLLDYRYPISKCLVRYIQAHNNYFLREIRH